MTVVRDLVGEIRDLRLERRLRRALPSRLCALVKARVFLQSLAHLVAEIQAREFRVAQLDHVHDAQALLIVIEAAVLVHQLVERLLARVPKGRMPEVVRERDDLGEILIQPERARDGARDVRDFKSVRKPRAQVIAGAVQKDLRLVFQPPERAAVDHTRAVALVIRAMRMLRLGMDAPLGIARFLRIARQHHALLRLQLVPRADHFRSPFVFASLCADCASMCAMSCSMRRCIARAAARMIRMSNTASSSPAMVSQVQIAQ